MAERVGPRGAPGAGGGRTSRASTSALPAAFAASREDLLYHFKAGPAGGRRPPSGSAATRRSPGSRPHPRSGRKQPLAASMVTPDRAGLASPVDSDRAPERHRGPRCRGRRQERHQLAQRPAATWGRAIGLPSPGAGDGGVGGALLRKVIAAYPLAKRAVPGSRLSPRIYTSGCWGMTPASSSRFTRSRTRSCSRITDQVAWVSLERSLSIPSP